MSSKNIRQVTPGKLYELTIKTIQGRFFFVPSKRRNSIIAGVFARAQWLYQLEICAIVVLSNHMHLLVRPTSAEQVASFCQFALSNLSKKIGWPVGWFGGLFPTPFRMIEVTDEPEAQIQRLKYILSHGVKEGLVKRPQLWPGVHCVRALLTGTNSIRGIWFNKTAYGQSKRRTTGKKQGPSDFEMVEYLNLSPIPVWSDLPEEEVQGLIQGLLDEIEVEHADKIKAVPPKSVAQIRSQRVGHRPKKTKRSPRPPVHAASREALEEFKESRRHFVDQFEAASIRWRNGDETALQDFPPGSFVPWLKGSSLAVVQARPG